MSPNLPGPGILGCHLDQWDNRGICRLNEQSAGGIIRPTMTITHHPESTSFSVLHLSPGPSGQKAHLRPLYVPIFKIVTRSFLMSSFLLSDRINCFRCFLLSCSLMIFLNFREMYTIFVKGRKKGASKISCLC